MVSAAIETSQNILLTVQSLRTPSNDENNNFSINTNIRRSLFGSPNTADIQILLEQEHKLDMQRFLDDYGIDIDDMTQLKADFVAPCESRRALPRLKITNTRFLQRRAFQLYNKKTDFCDWKKNSCTENKTS